MRALKSIFCTFLAAASLAYAQTNTMTVEIGSSRSSNNAVATAVTLRAKKFAVLTDAAKRRLMWRYPAKQLSFPTRVILTSNGSRLVTRTSRSSGPISLVFNTAVGFNLSSNNPLYGPFLQSVFNATVSEINRLFGQPWQGGQILVSDYDATIDDRDAVAGGIYLPNNGSGQQEIRFPEYGTGSGTKSFVPDYETAAVNFVHTLLLAYQGTTPYSYDAFEEGLARAVTMKIMREGGFSFSQPIDQTQVEAVLASSYDVYGSYDWDNQRALGGPVFIAPNLITTSPTIPVGTNGGAYLLRYRMAGSAWYKVLSEYPLFAAQLNTMVQANPSLASNVPALVAAAQTILSTDQPASATVEGLPFAQWFAQQYILQTNITAGNKVLVEVVPEPPDASQVTIPDFGLFDIQTSYFATDFAGNESFPNPNGGLAYPLYLDNSYNRFSPSAQDDTMAFFLGFGSVTPNFLSSFTGGLIYRVAIDIPVNDQVQRVFVPAGGVSTSLNTNTNEVYGTVSGEDPPTGGTEDVKIYCGSDLVTDAPVVNGAFGVDIEPQFDLEYSIARQIEAQVWLTVGGTSTMILDRFVDKSLTGNITPEIQEGLGLDLRVGATSSYSLALTAGINAIGFPIDPFSSDAPTVLGLDPSQLLVARYDGITGQYLLNPSVGPFKIGHGYFVETPGASTANVVGRSSAATPISVALEPGWNLISCPLPVGTTGTQVLVYHANDLSTPSDFTDASSAGSLVGNTFFSFVPGANDPATGYPTTGSFTAATEFLPGQAYFVQCLAPEGLVLEFIPSTTVPVKQRGLVPPSPVAPAPVARVPVPMASSTSSPSMAWEMHVTLLGGAGDKADCVIGESPSATLAFDRALDSGIPPSMGGLQIVSQNTIPLYRDFRPVGPSVSYTLAVSNLIVGKPYSMRFVPEVGNALRMTLKNPQGVNSNIARNGQFYFVATSSSETFTFTAAGVGL